MMAQRTIATDLTTGQVRKQLLRFSIPIMLANLLQAVYSLVDMAIVGKFVGSTGLSAVGIGAQIMNIFLAIGMSIGSAGQILVAQQMGAKDTKGINDTIGTLFAVEALCGTVLSALCIFGRSVALHLMNTPQEAWAEANSYTLICGCGMLFIYGYNAVSAILRGMGESKLPMMIIGVAACLNLLLDLLFVAVMGMGVGGAALATVIGQGAAFLVAIAFLYLHRSGFAFDFQLQSFRIKRRSLMALLKLGVPLVLQWLLITISMTSISAMVNAFGLTASAVDSIGNKINNMLYIACGALSTGSAAMIGQCFGARDFDRIKHVHRTCLGLCMAVWVVISAVLLAFPTAIFGLFSSDPDVLGMAPVFLNITILYFFSASTMVPSFSLVEGIGYAGLGMVISILDGVVARIGLGILLGQWIGLYGYWIGNAGAGLVTTVLAGIYYWSGRWRKRRPIFEAE